MSLGSIFIGSFRVTLSILETGGGEGQVLQREMAASFPALLVFRFGGPRCSGHLAFSYLIERGNLFILIFAKIKRKARFS